MTRSTKRARRGPIWARRSIDTSEIEKHSAEIDGAVERTIAFAELKSVTEAAGLLRRRDVNIARKGEVAAGLVAAYRSGNEAAATALLAEFAPLVSEVAHHFAKTSGLSLDEIKDLGRAALGEAIGSDARAVSPKVVLKVFKQAVWNGVRREARAEQRWRNRSPTLVDATEERRRDSDERHREQTDDEAIETITARTMASSAPKFPVADTHKLLDLLSPADRALLVAVKVGDWSVSEYVAETRPELSKPQQETEARRLNQRLAELLRRLRRPTSTGRSRE